MRFKVTNQYAKARENALESFKDEKLARAFIKEKIETDALLKINVLYRLYDFDDLIEAFDANKIEAGASSTSEKSAASSGRGSGFSPTPFNTAPKPAGIPQQWNRKDNEEEEKIKK